MQAFEQGAIDYLVKPFDEARLADTVRGCGAPRARSTGGTPGWRRRAGPPGRPNCAPPRRAGPVQWIKASVGPSVKLIPVEQVAYLKSDEKYTLVVWEGGEALIRKTIRELADELDPSRFVQTHRSVIVNLHQVVQVTRS